MTVYTCEICAKSFNKDKALWKKHKAECRRPKTQAQLQMQFITSAAAQLIKPSLKRLNKRDKEQKGTAVVETEPIKIENHQSLFILQTNPIQQLLNKYGQGYKYRRPLRWRNVDFPEERYPMQGPFVTKIANFIYHHRTDPNLLNQLRIFDLEQQSSNQRYLLMKTMNQWASDRLRYLSNVYDLNRKFNAQKSTRMHLQVMQEKDELISAQKWLQMAYYYNNTIQCTAGATFFTELPSQMDKRRYMLYPIDKKPAVFFAQEEPTCDKCNQFFGYDQGQHCHRCQQNLCFMCSALFHSLPQNLFHKRCIALSPKVIAQKRNKPINKQDSKQNLKTKRKIRPLAQREDEIRRKAQKRRRRDPIRLYETHFPLIEEKIIEQLNSEELHGYEGDLYSQAESSSHKSQIFESQN